MSHMTVNQRNQVDRVDLTRPSTGVHVVHPMRVAITNVILLVICGVLMYATIQALDSWARAVVLAGIVVATIGAMIAVSPSRRA